MPRLLLLDPSLSEVGGHHFDYAVQVLRAAQKLGWQVALGCHRKFRAGNLMPGACPAFPVFRHHSYTRYSQLHGLQELIAGERDPRSLSRWLSPLKVVTSQVGRGRRIGAFAQGCSALAERHSLSPGDHVFAPCVSELDLLGLVRFLAANGGPPGVHWHLQFHFGTGDGLEPNQGNEQSIDALRQIFQRAIAAVPAGRIHFYCTSRPLANQYAQLRVAEFHELTYPLNPEFRPRSRLSQRSPLRITCAGNFRQEKGRQHLVKLAAELWDDCFANRKATLFVQASGSHRRELELALAQANVSDAVNFVPHPLPSAEYVELIRSADIGLCLYESRAYHARRAGILGEYLGGGIPVVVPGSCWLDAQVSIPIQQYRQSVEQHVELLSTVNASDGSRDHVQGVPRITRGRADQAAEFPVPAGATHLLVDFHCRSREDTHVRLEASQDSERGSRGESVVDLTQAASEHCIGMLPLDRAASTVRLRWAAVQHNRPGCLEAVRLRFARSKHELPSGAVGAVAAEPAQFPQALREVVAHYAHYRESAVQFSEQWRAMHDPARTIKQLVNVAQVGNLGGVGANQRRTA